jgi:hypothetical protein
MKLFRVDIDRRCLPAPRLGHRTPCFADGAVGIELKATLKTRKLLIPLIAKNAKNIEVAQLRYTPGTRSWESVDIGAVAVRFRRASSRQRRR